MNVVATALPEVVLIEPKVFGDDRGFFFESFHAPRYADAGIKGSFIQDNISYSKRHVLRGLHMQNPNPQGKLVFVLEGEVTDVAVDVRPGSPTFGRWVAAVLSSDNRRQIWVPEGFAHGFCVTSEAALVCYKCTDVYNQAAEMSLLWSDPAVGIAWPTQAPILSAKDAAAPCLAAIDPARLVPYAAATV
jgi:dTDP-4-dehydrorhamnose 3,5-epimerase